MSKRKLIRKRRNRLLNCYQETMNAVQTFMQTSMKEIIETNTDFSLLTKHLKQLRKQTQMIQKTQTNNLISNNGHDEIHVLIQTQIQKQIVLWEEIKNKSIVRLITSLYIHSILYLLFTVQIHLLGGIMFRNHLHQDLEHEQHTTTTTNSTDTDTDAATISTTILNEYTHNEILMQTIQNFMNLGVLNLLENISQHVEKETKSWIVIHTDNTLGTVTLDEFMNVIDRIRVIEGEFSFVDFVSSSSTGSDTCGTHNHNTCTQENKKEHQKSTRVDFDNDDGESVSENTDVIVKQIIDETLDIIESPVFEDAKKECFDLSFQTMKNYLKGILFQSDINQSTTGVINNTNMSSTSIHLVHLFGKLKSATNMMYTLCDEPTTMVDHDLGLSWGGEQGCLTFPNIYLKVLDRLDILKELGDVSFN